MKIKLFGSSVTDLLSVTSRVGDGTSGVVEERERENGGVECSIHHRHAGLTQQKTECRVRPLCQQGPGNFNNIFGRLSDCPIKEADI